MTLQALPCGASQKGGFQKGGFGRCSPGPKTGTRVHVDPLSRQKFVGVLRGNTIRGNTTRNSERKMALWEGLWEGLWKTSKNL